MQILVPNALFMLSRRAATFTDATPYRHGEAANIAIASLAAAACSGAAHADGQSRQYRRSGRIEMLTFRIAITTAVIAFIVALTACLVFIQLETFHAAARAAASAAMDAASANTLSRLETEVSELSSVVDVLSSNPSLADSDDRNEEDSAIVLFKAALHKLPQA